MPGYGVKTMRKSMELEIRSRFALGPDSDQAGLAEPHVPPSPPLLFHLSPLAG